MRYNTTPYWMNACPAHAERAMMLRDVLIDAGILCGLGLELEGDDDTVVGICLTFWVDGSNLGTGSWAGNNILGCATLDDEALSFWIKDVGSAETATDAELITAVMRGNRIAVQNIEKDAGDRLSEAEIAAVRADLKTVNAEAEAARKRSPSKKGLHPKITALHHK